MFNHGWFQRHKLVYFIYIKSRKSFHLNISIEKDQARFMINSALRGLKESERSSRHSQQNVDLNSLSNFVEK